jgi:CubicO group peptidase (beta-lactamase class C family)
MDLKSRVDAVVDSALEKKIVGTVLLIARHGEIVYSRAAGFADREAGRPMTEDAIFRLASITKPMVAATALAQVERGLLGLDNAVSDYLPWFRPKLPDGGEATIRISQLLTHTAGLAYDFPGEPAATTGMGDTDLTLEENLRRIAQRPLLFAPGTRWHYSVAIDVLGAIVGGIHGATLGDTVAHYVTEPLGMSDTGFAVTDPSRLAVPYADGTPVPQRMGDEYRRKTPEGRIQVFSPGRIFNPKAFHSGGAGAAGTAGDFLTFLEALRMGGSPILLPETVAQAAQNQIGDLPRGPEDAGQRFGYLSAILTDPKAANSPQGVGTINWGGAYGHTWFVDPDAGLTLVSFTNTAVEGCDGPYREEIRDAVYAGPLE